MTSKLRNPFDPKDGAFAQNIRMALDEGTNGELRESMKAFGWNKKLPAMADENGVIIVGHRRLKVARELGIEPLIETIAFGKGDAADAERVALAIASNIGFKAMTPEDRKRIAEHLYGNHEWTMQRIGTALGVTHKTISKDLSEFVPKVQTTRPKGGRPKAPKPRNKPSAKPGSLTQRAKEVLLDKPDATRNDIKEIIGKTGNAVIDAAKAEIAIEKAREAGHREGLREAAESQIKPEGLTKTGQEKIAILERRLQREWKEQFEEAVQTEAKKRLAEMMLPAYQKELDQAAIVLKNRKGIMSRTLFAKLRFCVHPDTHKNVTLADLNALSQFVEEYSILFLGEKDLPTEAHQLPRSVEEFLGA